MTQTLPNTTVGAAPFSAAVARDASLRAKRWDLTEFIAEGSLARVYRARPAGSSAERPAAYAVKILRPCWENDPEAIRLLRREALVGRSVAHPRLVSILSASLAESPRLLVMPWLEGASLRVRMDAGERMSIPRMLWIARQTAEALDALHAAGWTHGDVAPSNILVSPTGHATLIDLSFARRPHEIGSIAARPIAGTCRYVAPEYFSSALKPDIRSDIYSLGATLFEMLAGRPPFEAENLTELAALHRQSAPADLARLAPAAPREIVRLIGQMTAREPLRRPQTPRELIDRLVELEIAWFAFRG